MSDTTQHDKIVFALSAWIRQRPGLEYANYGDASSYMSESRRITRQGKDARRLLDEARRTGPHTDAAWADAFRAFSGRLTWSAETSTLDYCTGQYWPTEYRAAAAAVLASLLWARMRDAMPAPAAVLVVEPSAWDGNIWRKGRELARYTTTAEAESARRGGGLYPNAQVEARYGLKLLSAGDYLRAQFRYRFGARFAAKWFN